MDPQTAVSVRVKNSINSSPHFTQSLIVSLLLFLFSISLRCIIVTSSFARFARSATSPSFAYVSNPVPDSSLCRAAAPRLRPLQLLLSARLHRSVSTVILLSSRLASASAAALVCVRFSCTASRLCPFRLLLPDCVHFNSAPQWRPLRLLLPDCFRFNSAASTSSATPRLRPLQLLLPDCVRFGCCSPIASASTLLPNGVRFVCCSPIVSASTLLPNGVRFVCCSPIVSASTLLPNGVRFVCCSPIVSASTLLHPLHLLLPDCVRFGCCSPIASASTLLPNGVRFVCCSPIVSASTLLPNGIRFVCCSPIASASTAAPRLRPLQLLLRASCSGRFQLVHYSRRFYAEFEVQ